MPYLSDGNGNVKEIESTLTFPTFISILALLFPVIGSVEELVFDKKGASNNASKTVGSITRIGDSKSTFMTGRFMTGTGNWRGGSQRVHL
jgi:hypothetical protein